jgi:hypothetical protein
MGAAKVSGAKFDLVFYVACAMMKESSYMGAYKNCLSGDDAAYMPKAQRRIDYDNFKRKSLRNAHREYFYYSCGQYYV